MTITVTGETLEHVKRQVGVDDYSYFIKIRRRPSEDMLSGMSPPGCIVELHGHEVPKMFESAAEAAAFIAEYLEERDAALRSAETGTVARRRSPTEPQSDKPHG